MNSHPISSWFPVEIPEGPVSIDPGENEQAILCDCCGRRTIRVNGFVDRQGWACAVYFAVWTEGHIQEQGLDVIISVGGWGEGMSHHPRHLIALRCRVTGGFPQFMILDPVEHGIAKDWATEETKFLGTLVSREEALHHPDMKEVFRLAEHIIYNDQRINAALRDG
ncbi:hypothetical protein [Microvirga splendida]|uniref:Uncharacterized protein n=1 Tax=Microvirga splendida TaxID=2795727 RepID=A0ABS0Y5X7_9HYPH|nr:hypothetical protein [Microvirga splendida]MBJ6127709.1 hypothetical protein [Microvirga splendida]